MRLGHSRSSSTHPEPIKKASVLQPRTLFMVGEVGLEPTRLIQSTDFKSIAYTNSATRP